MHGYTVTLVLVLFALLVGYVLGRAHRRDATREAVEEGRLTYLVRPHTARSVKKFPLPEEVEDLSTVQDATWVRTNLPNSGVDWN